MTTTDAQRGRVLAAQVATFLFLGLYPAWAGQFLAAPEYPLPGPGVAVADFNGDAIADVAVAGGSLNVSLGNGDGTFQAYVAYPGNGLSALVVADLNQDGKLDVAASFPSDLVTPGGISVFLGNGDGTFQPRVDYLAGFLTSNVAIGDFNGDGNLDMVAPNYVDNTFSVFIGRGDGTFRPPVTYAAGNNPLGI